MEATDSVLVAIKVPGKSLELTQISQKAGPLREQIRRVIGDTVGLLTVRQYHVDNSIRCVTMWMDDYALEKVALEANFPHPGHPELHVRGVAVFTTSVEQCDSSTGEMIGLNTDLSENDIAIVQELVG